MVDAFHEKKFMIDKKGDFFDSIAAQLPIDIRCNSDCHCTAHQSADPPRLHKRVSARTHFWNGKYAKQPFSSRKCIDDSGRNRRRRRFHSFCDRLCLQHHHDVRCFGHPPRSWRTRRHTESTRPRFSNVHR